MVYWPISPQNTYDDAAFDVKKNEKVVHVSLSESDKLKKHDDKDKRDDRGKNMPELEDIVYSDDEEYVGVEADLSNLETNISEYGKDEETKKVHQALKDPSWIEAMQEELLQFKMQKVWILVDLPMGKRAIGTYSGGRHSFDEVFAPVAKIEAIWLFLAYASFMGFMVYHMDVKSAFLYGTIEEEVYVCQPPGFEYPDYLDKNEKVVHVSLSESDKLKKHDDKDKRDDRGKSHVDLPIGVRDLRAKFEEFSINSTNRVNAVSAPVTTVGPNPTNNTNNMPELEDIVYSDDEEYVGVEADLSNLETNISEYGKDETKKVHQALKDPSWIEAMQEELLQFKMQKVWILVDLPMGKRAIGTYSGGRHSFDEVFAPVAKIEAIWLFLAYASFMGFMVYHMDVKSAFLYGTIEEEVYVCQPPGFEYPDYLDKV
nr:hypothetical protein [Tanacetum cinerariifolium]